MVPHLSGNFCFLYSGIIIAVPQKSPLSNRKPGLSKNTLAPDLSDAKVLLLFQKFLDTLIFSSGNSSALILPCASCGRISPRVSSWRIEFHFTWLIGHQLGLILINRNIIPLRRDKALRILRK